MDSKKFVTLLELAELAQEDGVDIDEHGIQDLIYLRKVLDYPQKIEGKGPRNQRYFKIEVLDELKEVLLLHQVWEWDKVRRYRNASRRERKKMMDELRKIIDGT